MRCRRTSDMDTHIPRFGVAETISIVAAAAGLLANLLKLLNKVSDVKSKKKGDVRLLVDQLESTTRDCYLLNIPTPAAVVEVLNRLELKAQKLLKSVSYGLPHRVVSAIAHGSFNTRIGELRTGIADIRNTLLPLAPQVSSYQAGLALSQQHLLASAPASSSIPAPGGPFIQVTVACPLHHNMNAAQAPVVMQGQNPVHTVPLGYPPTVYSPAVYPPVLYPSFGSPAYGYAHGYTSK